MKDEIEKVRRHTMQNWFNDGLTEIAFGILCLVMSLYFFALTVIPEKSLLSNLLNASLALVIIGGTLLARRIILVAKARLTYQRTGYIAFPQKRSNHWASALLAMGIAALVAFLIAQEPGSLIWLPAITALLIAFVMLIFGLRTGLARFSLIGLISLLLGGGLSLSGFGDILGISLYYGTLGLVIGVSGGCTLRNYTRKFPLEEPGNGK